MMRSCEQCRGISRKRVIFGVALFYAVAFLVVQYRYGWSFLAYFVGFGYQSRTFLSSPPEVYPLPDLVLRDFGNSSDLVNVQHQVLDIHYEDSSLGHTGETSGHSDHSLNGQLDMSRHIAIGGGITSKKLSYITKDNIKNRFQFFSILMPSFCKTVSAGFCYHFYLAYDVSDPVFGNQDLLSAFNDAFYDVGRSLCPHDLNISIHFIQCSHQGHPAWAQNDAMMEAYLDGMEYFYRVNDDSILESSGWVEAFINTLAGYEPKNVGVVGPRHIGGNEQILTYDFVHRTHVEMFGFYYPRVFTDWYADDWVTKVYVPGRMTKLSDIHLKHTMTLGQRYRNDFSIYPKLESQLKKDKEILLRYISYKKTDFVQQNSSKVIAMSVYGNIPKFTMGAIRNAQILPIYFPGWTLRVYVANPNSNDTEKKWIVPGRILVRLKMLNVQIVYVDTARIKLEPKWWSHLVADDRAVKYFIVRRADGRLNARDAVAVSDFVEASSQTPGAAFHCVRDHSSHSSLAVTDGLWGGLSDGLLKRMKPGIHTLIQDYLSNHTTSAGKMRPDDFLSNIVWPLVQDVAYCHDSVSCKKWPNTYSFPGNHSTLPEYVGQKFNDHQEPEGGLNANELTSHSSECSGKGKWKPSMATDVKISSTFSIQPVKPRKVVMTGRAILQPTNSSNAGSYS